MSAFVVAQLPGGDDPSGQMIVTHIAASSGRRGLATPTHARLSALLKSDQPRNLLRGLIG